MDEKGTKHAYWPKCKQPWVAKVNRFQIKSANLNLKIDEIVY